MRDYGIDLHDDLASQKRQLILSAAREVFFERGYARAKIEEIARRAKVANVTIYNHFPGKDELFQEVVRHAFDSYRNEFDHVERTQGAPRDRLMSFAMTYFRFMCEPSVRAMYRIIIAEQNNFPTLARELCAASHKLLGATLRRIMVNLMERGELEVRSVPMSARMMQGMIEHSVLTIPMLQGNEAAVLHPIEELCAEVVDCFLARYGTDRGNYTQGANSNLSAPVDARLIEAV